MASFRKETIMSASLLLLLVLVASTTWGNKDVIVMSAAAAAEVPTPDSCLAEQDDCQGREQVLLLSGCETSVSGPVMASRGDASPSTATLFINSPGIGDITFHIKFKQQQYDPSGLNSALPPSPPQAFWGLFIESNFMDEVEIWVGDYIFGHTECVDVILPSSRTLSYNDDFFNVTFTRAELKRIGLLMCEVTSLAFVAKVNTYIDNRGENNDDMEPSWQLHSQLIAWNEAADKSFYCINDEWIPYASFSLRYCPCASPPPPPSPPSPPSPPPPPPPPPLFCGGSLSFVRDDAYLSSFTGDLLFDETSSLMSYEYRLSEYKTIHSAAQLSATPGTPEQEASISMQVFLDLPAGTEVYWKLFDMQTYYGWVSMTDRWTWCLGPPYVESDYMMYKFLDAPATNISIPFTLSDLQSLGLGACTNSTFMLLVRIRPPTGGDYYVGWDTDGCNQDGFNSFWPLVRLVVWHCPCPPPPAQPPPEPPPPPPRQPPSLPRSPTPSPRRAPILPHLPQLMPPSSSRLSPPPITRPTPKPPSLYPFPRPPPSATMPLPFPSSSSHPSPPPRSSPPPAPRTTRPPPSKSTSSPRPRPPPFTSPPSPPALPPPSPPKPPKSPRMPRVPGPSKPPPHPGQPAKPARPARARRPPRAA
ncbi:hypothetical protein VaNZ11_007935 [Volvox africanus]|uniref:Pherophorin domain-containing protein n=1 Tax=Volvox africanus TaxID=51714 RepID=A0ABQ5S3Z5_9CHLO|nr:hypothetical protein VaNZ11_007935 [Volvox africanus]